MKRAVIVVGSHYAGKSKTIKKFFKPLVGISGNRRLFQLDNYGGAVLSQSLEERFGNGHVLSQSLEERRAYSYRTVGGSDPWRLLSPCPRENLAYESAIEASDVVLGGC